jgi:5'-3' exonuclease
MNGYLLIDGNSVGFGAQNTTKLTVGGHEVQAIFGVIRTIRNMLETYTTKQPLVLWDGASWRKEQFAFYKKDRDRDPKVAASRVSYKAQRPTIAKMLKNLGVSQLAAPNLEADDLAGMYVRAARRKNLPVVLASGDRDWLQLVQPQVVWMDFIRERSVNLSNFEEFTGYATTRAFVEGKALQGDTSDQVPGVGGIGEKGAKELLGKYGSVKAFFDWCDRYSVVELPKKWRDFALDPAKRAAFDRNMKIMDLAHPDIPKPVRFSLVKGEFTRQGVTDLCAELAFNSILKDFDAFIEPFSRRAAA